MYWNSGPEMVVLWAGYAFSKDYSTPRGHMHAIETLRQLFVPVRLPLLRMARSLLLAGLARARCAPHDGAIGVDAFYNNKWGALGDEIVNPIGCADCHEPENMNLHISRPALIELLNAKARILPRPLRRRCVHWYVRSAMWSITSRATAST